MNNVILWSFNLMVTCGEIFTTHWRAYRPCKAGGRKGKGQCEMPLLFILSRKAGRKPLRLYSGSRFTGSSESGVFNLASSEGKMDRYHTQGIVGRTDLKTKQNKAKNP